MPYPNERAGFSALEDLDRRRIVEAFGDRLAQGVNLPPKSLPRFEPFPRGTSRPIVVALDGSSIYHRIPARLPVTEAGLLSIAIVRIDVQGLVNLARLPESGAIDPVQLRDTEDTSTLQLALPGRNARSADGQVSRDWFRSVVQEALESGHFGGETLADTLHALLARTHEERNIKCPNVLCESRPLTPPPGQLRSRCQNCGTAVLLSDALRAQEIFSDEQPCGDAHGRIRQAFEILCLLNLLRGLVESPNGRAALRRIAFVLDGPLAAFSTIAAIQPGVLQEISRIDSLLSPGRLLVMSAVKTGAFVQHFAELDEAPAPDSRIPRGTVFLPDDDYIRENIIARTTDQPWGQITYFGRPVVVKTHGGQRLFLNLAQPEAAPPLTDAPHPVVLKEAIATAERLGVGHHEFLPLRRAHAKAAIPLRIGTTIIESLAKPQ
ncbi:MAG: hypothetical protein OXE58_11035 [Acidobacteria bacterium]|nr:hypothetical protein [Acidobacteriota bacterium]